MESGSEIVKTSKAGHILTSRQRREELFGEFDRSGLSAALLAFFDIVSVNVFQDATAMGDGRWAMGDGRG